MDRIWFLIVPPTIIILAAVLILPLFSSSAKGGGRDDNPVYSEITSLVDREYPDLEIIYKHIHENPELSLQEKETSALAARELRAAGYEVTENVGGYGVVGVLRNGDGPTVLLRGDMDALPITELTGLPYASKVRAEDHEGREVGVMHACGHDVHTTVLIGNARVLAKLRDKWHGTLVLVAQPAEEGFGGAASMMADGLYTRFPRPDYALACHVRPQLPAGVVAFREGQALAGTSTLQVTVRGMGGHGSSPNETIDPVVLAARIVLALQTIVSREVDPREPAVLTVGQIHGGTAANIIPAEVRLSVNLRFTSESTYRQMREAVERICRGVAASAGLPESLMPIIEESGKPLPSVYNDPGLGRRVAESFRGILGGGNVHEAQLVMGSEDFSLFSDGEPPVPTLFFWLGVNDPDFLKSVEGKSLGDLDVVSAGRLALHTPYLSPLPEPSIKTGMKAFCAAVVDLMSAKD